jgi:hypothetical protein
VIGKVKVVKVAKAETSKPLPRSTNLLIYKPATVNV